MIIKLSPQRRDSTLSIYKSKDTIIVNGYSFDFSNLKEGSSISSSNISSEWFIGDVIRKSDVIEITLILPNPVNYSPEQAFPVPLTDVQDGPVVLPRPLPDEEGNYPEVIEFDPSKGSLPGIIDWSKMVTQEMKDAEQAAIVRAAAVLVEDAWRVEEVEFVADQLIAMEDEDPDALPGTTAQWRAYRTKVRGWKEGNVLFPNLADRPVRPTEE